MRKNKGEARNKAGRKKQFICEERFFQKKKKYPKKQ